MRGARAGCKLRTKIVACNRYSLYGSHVVVGRIRDGIDLREGSHKTRESQ